ncbi:MAG: type I 3-dehydroquinate dehydratase [Candidatus Diapherotrites archaeon]
MKPLVCVPVTARTTKEALKDIAGAKKLAGCVELRIDYLMDLSEENLEKLIKACRGKAVVTNRSRKEGGYFRESEKKRLGFLLKAVGFGARMVDLEFSALKNSTAKKILRKKGNAKVILSYHNFKKTPARKELKKLFERMIRVKGADILKIVTYAKNPMDTLAILGLLRLAKKAKKPSIIFAMGEKGRHTRMLSMLEGAFLGFASLSKDKASAQGQLDAKKLSLMLKKL